MSIIIPVYNGERYIEETIRSIQCSKYEDIEIVVVIDGSFDHSKEIVERLQLADHRIKLFHQKNSGVSAARNYGVKMSMGDYICFVDQDDIVKPNMYFDLISLLEQDNSDIAMCSSARLVNNKEILFDYHDNRCFQKEEIKENLLYPIMFMGYDIPIKYDKRGHKNHIWNCVFRSSFFVQSGLRFRAYVNYEDDMMVKIEALAKAVRVSTLSDVGYLWRANTESQSYEYKYIPNSKQRHEKMVGDLINVLNDANAPDDVLEWYRRILICRYYIVAVQNSTSEDFKSDNDSIRKYFDSNIYNYDFNHAIKVSKYVKKGMIEPTIILFLLRPKMTYSTFGAEKLIQKLNYISMRSYIVNSFERWIKNR